MSNDDDDKYLSVDHEWNDDADNLDNEWQVKREAGQTLDFCQRHSVDFKWPAHTISWMMMMMMVMTMMQMQIQT